MDLGLLNSADVSAGIVNSQNQLNLHDQAALY